MFPIRDHNPSGRVPYVTYALMALNIAIFLSYVPILSDPRQINLFFASYALIPAEVSQGGGLHGLFTSMFLHAGWMHLAGNMLFLWIYGDNVEDEMGHLPYLGFYLACGIAAGLGQVLFEPSSFVPMVGASGAIAGVMGGYLLLFPKAKIDILIIFVVFFRVFPIPAWIILMLWFAMQFIGGMGATPESGGVAYWAHAGGFIAGLAFTLPLWLRRGGVRFWSRTDGHPPHPAATYPVVRSRIPKVRRR
ncbi:rhomboid family intramembrane serine protease [Sulfitobacter alexandrii]|uniref:Rhomboid family intramembrane serine protease n=1 Tax=Sulfitobacter alexandrii TaxID=1917485 RepID=A0A1J0WII5_9RHOB|nr:rhomboid family intramembrane serine protease [Sulfitobacter alexandrii]APE44130.1 rhomboid family intramembrane serine protease [Sulfitobacter alexandrii]